MIKKFSIKLVLTMLILMVGTVANAAVKLSLGQIVNATPGDVIEVPVYLDNAEGAVSSVGFDARFPKGLVPVEMVKDDTRCKGTQGWVVAISQALMNPGAWTAGITNINHKNIGAGTGAIGTIKVKVTDIVESGTVTLENVEIIFAANGKPAEVEIEEGEIETSNVYSGTMAFTANEEVAVYPGEEFTVSVALSNDAYLRAFQSKLALPEGFEVAFDQENEEFKMSGSDRMPNGYMLSYNPDADILAMLITSGDQIAGTEGELFTFTVKAPEEFEDNAVITLNGFTGNVFGFTTSFIFDSKIAITVRNQAVIDKAAYDAAKLDAQALKDKYAAAWETINKDYPAAVNDANIAALDKPISEFIDGVDKAIEDEYAERPVDFSQIAADIAAQSAAIDELLNAAKAAQEEADKLVPGDINNDGTVDAIDLALFIQALANKQLPAAATEDFERYDANGDKALNIADAQAIFNIIISK